MEWTASFLLVNFGFKKMSKIIIDNNLKFVWGCQTRIDQFSKNDFQLMYDAGCRWVFFGI